MPSASTFSLSSSAGALTAGEAGIVLSRFLSTAEVVARPVEVALPAVPGRVVRLAGLAGVVFRGALGLVTEGRVVVDGRTVVRLAGVPTTLRVVEVRSAVVDGAIDIRLGLAEMPSFFSSALSSVTELREVRDLWVVAAEGVVVEGVLRAVLVRVERTGGLLRDEDVVVLDVEVGAVREAVVEGVVRVVVVLGAVSGRRAVVVPALGVAFSSLLLSAMMTRAYY